MQTETLVPIHDSHLGRFNTANGRLIDLELLSEYQISIDDISVGLSNICRFGGQIKNFYSVAQHSILVMHLAPDEIKREAFMHDASEAYLGDVIKPLKIILGAKYALLESSFMATIAHVYNLSMARLVMVKEADMQALELEHEALQKGNVMPLMIAMNKYGMLDGQPHCFWTPEVARREFYRTYVDLFKPAL